MRAYISEMFQRKCKFRLYHAEILQSDIVGNKGINLAFHK